jgi:GDP-L-fucose synthase
LLARILAFDGELTFEVSRQDGTPQKLLDVSRIHRLGWKAKVGLEEGIRRTYEAVRSRLESISL